LLFDLLVQETPNELEHLNCSLDQRHLGGAIVAMIQFNKAWTALNALELSDDK
jgi:hypothetical protein